MAKTDLTNQRQVFVEEYVRSGDNHYAGDAVQSIREELAVCVLITRRVKVQILPPPPYLWCNISLFHTKE